MPNEPVRYLAPKDPDPGPGDPDGLYIRQGETVTGGPSSWPWLIAAVVSGALIVIGVILGGGH